MSYLRYLCLFVYGVQHILCYGFVLFVFDLCCQLLWIIQWIVHFSLPIRYSLTFMHVPNPFPVANIVPIPVLPNPIISIP